MNYEEKYKAILARQKTYRQAHKAEISAYFKAWYERNKKALSVKRKEKTPEHKTINTTKQNSRRELTNGYSKSK